ncbi:MAG: hypothetical protein PHU25_10465 [Deltaproteobacteria bacterium]|nr:hypothetical protein [Deltaproteobacteria bacterium]
MDSHVFLTVFPYWLKAFLFTQGVEIPIWTLLARGAVPAWRAALAGAACTCLTHPLLWFVWPRVVHDYGAYIASGELLVAAIESAVFFVLARPVTFSRAVAASFLANAASYGGGLLLRSVGALS